MKEEIRQAILSTLVVSNPQSFDHTWKKIEEILEKYNKKENETHY